MIKFWFWWQNDDEAQAFSCFTTDFSIVSSCNSDISVLFFLLERSAFKGPHQKPLFGEMQEKGKIIKERSTDERIGKKKCQPHPSDSLWLEVAEGGGGGGGRKGSGWERVNPLCIKLERFIIYHYTKPEIYTQLSLTPTKSKNITWGGANHQSGSSRQWAKLICKYIQEIKKLNYTGKWGSYTWIVRIMNNYCELPAPNITIFFNKQRLNYRIVLENFRSAH